MLHDVIHYAANFAILLAIYLIGRIHGYHQYARELKVSIDKHMKERGDAQGIGAYQASVPGACKFDNGDRPVAASDAVGAVIGERAEN